MISYYYGQMSDATFHQIQTLINELKDYSETNPKLQSSWLPDFGRWLQHGASATQDSSHTGIGDEDSLIGMFLVLLNNLTRNRLNQLVHNTPFGNIMDYHFLVFLDSHGRQRKTDLIAINHMEMSSGIEVIRRLIKNDWIKEEPNPEDRRSKYVTIAPAGTRLITDLKPQIDEFYRSFCSRLDPEHKSEVLKTLELLVTKIEGDGNGRTV